jgi:hypothetical protein
VIKKAEKLIKPPRISEERREGELQVFPPAVALSKIMT